MSKQRTKRKEERVRKKRKKKTVRRDIPTARSKSGRRAREVELHDSRLTPLHRRRTHIVTFTLSYFYSIPYAFVLALSGESDIYCVINDFLFSSLFLPLFLLYPALRKGYVNVKDARGSGGTSKEDKERERERPWRFLTRFDGITGGRRDRLRSAYLRSFLFAKKRSRSARNLYAQRRSRKPLSFNLCTAPREFNILAASKTLRACVPGPSPVGV